MTHRPDLPLDDATLHAYVDGQLAPEDQARVQAALAHSTPDALRVRDWHAQREQLRALQAGVLDEPVPPALLAALQPAPRHGLQALAAALLLALGLAAGVPAGMAWQAQRAAQVVALRVPTFVRDATVAHVLYTPERRHPVEVGAAEQAHLVQWLSKRLGTSLRVPVLEAEGYALVGGRLLPGAVNGDISLPAGTPTGARAQFMYENASGRRLTLYVSVFAPGAAVPTGFVFAGPVPGSAARSFYWLDGRQGYALTAELPGDELAVLARAVYAQLSPESSAAPPSTPLRERAPIPGG